jgi:hypothetical protein
MTFVADRDLGGFGACRFRVHRHPLASNPGI